ncbi:MAG: hypothetical protein ACXWPG_21120, partial [Ktedonobacteraceae bacterium]
MDVRQSPPRILYIATWIVIIGILGSLQWLITAPPTAFVNYQPLLALHPCGYWWRILRRRWTHIWDFARI